MADEKKNDAERMGELRNATLFVAGCALIVSAIIIGYGSYTIGTPTWRYWDSGNILPLFALVIGGFFAGVSGLLLVQTLKKTEVVA